MRGCRENGHGVQRGLGDGVKDRALEIVAARPASVDGTNVLREYLQSRILMQLQAQGAFVPLAFMGGTALRFRYGIPRFSEDLDFTLERDAADFDFTRLVERVVRGLGLEGYAVEASRNERAAVSRAMIGFPGLMAEAGLSPHDGQKLSIKLEVDTNPPAGAGLETYVIRRLGPIQVQFHDRPSLFAGKIAAVLARPYTKGRDLFDLWWYLTRGDELQPNLTLLGSALDQTAPAVAASATADWRSALDTRLRDVDWEDAYRDVAAFLEDPATSRAIFSAAEFAELLRAQGAD